MDPVLYPQTVCGVIRMIDQLGVADCGPKCTPQLLAAHGDHDVNVLCGKCTIGNDRRIRSAERLWHRFRTEIDHKIACHRGDHGIEHGEIHELSHTGSVSTPQRHQNSNQSKHPGAHIGDGVTAAYACSVCHSRHT